MTARLLLGAFVPSHVLLSDPLTNTVGAGPFTELGQTERWIRNRVAFRESHGLCWYAVRERENNTLIGNCGLLSRRTGVGEPEIGYLISAGHRGRGLASEAAEAVLAECRSAGLPRIRASLRPHNLASRRIVERLGLHFDRTGHDERGALDLWLVDLSTRDPIR
ncbi:GNAT family N-acetyltransferase [Actinoplanes sp. CA-252034]|uniref:GNAT family N-acetyltransferase n=1 Tax=Actinoplanes sp. CA-252034 TaxID=3239906 RepID=UPI003D966592